jgi:transcriptional accessory protein Tex/SPT6
LSNRHIIKTILAEEGVASVEDALAGARDIMAEEAL